MKKVIWSVLGGFACTSFENYCSYPMNENEVSYYLKKDGYNTYLDVVFSYENHERIDFIFH